MLISIFYKAIFGAVRQTVKAAQAYREAPEQIDSLLNDLADAEIIIRTVESSLQDHSNTTRIPQEQLKRVCNNLEKSKDALLELEVLIRMQVNQTGSTPKYRHVAWLMAKKKAAKLKRKLENVCDELRSSLGEFKTLVKQDRFMLASSTPLIKLIR